MTERVGNRRGTGSRRSLNPREILMAERVSRSPLASAANMAGMYGEDKSTCDRVLKSLEEKRLLKGADTGYSQRRQRRYWVVDPKSPDPAGMPQPEHPELISALLTRLILAESVYCIVETALAAEPKRRLVDFQWRFDDAMDAQARFNDGWIAFQWSGVWQTRQMLAEKLENMFASLRASRPGGVTPLPGRICLVVPDAWQADLVRRVVSQLGLSERCLIHNASNNQTDGNHDLSNSRGQPPRRDREHSNRRPDRLDSLLLGIVDQPDATALMRTAMLVEQWPGALRGYIKNLTGLNGGSTTSSLRQLIDLGVAWRTAQDGYAPSKSWLAIAARRDRVWSGRPGDLFDPEKVAELYAGRIATHEEGIARLAGWFAAAGCPVAPGWRFRDIMGRQGQMAPDAMVLLKESPFGATWCYVEYERSATKPSKVQGKLRAYHSHLRSDDYPVLVVCRRKAIPNFLRQGAGLRMLIAAVEDVRQQNVTGETGTVWLQDGNPVLRLR